MADISISREHAEIRNYSGKFHLVDRNSKFGTLVKLNKPTVIPAKKNLTLQVGRTVLDIKNEIPTCCCCIRYILICSIY